VTDVTTEQGPRRDRVAERRAATRREFIVAACFLAQDKGLAEFTLRDLADAIGLRAPSLYTHLASKDAIYDAMFAQGWADFVEVSQAWLPELPEQPRASLKVAARVFFDFAVENPVRYQLMHQRVIPGFAPSRESYAPSLRMQEIARHIFENLGTTDPADLDIWTALVSGMAHQQIANDLGGTRWSDQLDRVMDMFADGIGLPR
jgi:AcrR family transcriptional regulator